MEKNIGFGFKSEVKEKCSDKHCPLCGEISIRGNIFSGKVTSTNMQLSAKVEWNSSIKDKKYLRYLKRTSKVIAHNSKCINAKVGEEVVVAETRPISKTKHFVIIKVK